MKLSDNSRVREHDIQSPIFGHCILNHGFHGRLVRSIELSQVNSDIRISGVKFSLLCC
jgi:hypothetical protein